MTGKNGKLIAFEAIDGAGKSTQVRLLVKRLRRLGKKVVIADFPQYERSFFGKMVRRYLNGEFGGTHATNPYFISLLYALDRFEAKGRMQVDLTRRKIIVADRYSPSNQIHQAAKIGDQAARNKFLAWLNEMELKVLGVPRADLVIFLDVPPVVTRQLMKARGKRDMHEVDYQHQKLAYAQCRRLAGREKTWRRIVCLKSGKLLPIQAVHELVWRQVEKII